jgi:hypothetical protein
LTPARHVPRCPSSLQSCPLQDNGLTETLTLRLVAAAALLLLLLLVVLLLVVVVVVVVVVLLLLLPLQLLSTLTHPFVSAALRGGH